MSGKPMEEASSGFGGFFGPMVFAPGRNIKREENMNKLLEEKLKND